MPAVQTTYTAVMPIGSVGEVADLSFSDVISRECQPATCAFGVAVIQGTADHQANVGGAGVFLGISVRDVSLDSRRNDAYAQYDTMGVMTKGVMFVLAGEAVVAGDIVYRTATGALNKTAASNTLIANARWETTAANGALAKLRLS